MRRRDEKDIDPQSAQDKRSPGQDRELHLAVATAVISQVRTVAAGERFAGEANTINLPAHRDIIAKSPLKAAASQPAGEADSLLRKNALDDYVSFLNRHPGRRVDTAISSTGPDGQVGLDYLLTEDKPWAAYFQILNTGTRYTSKWRQRIGFLHTQLTGHDDILSIDYLTGGFETDHQLAGSYEAPFFKWDRLRWKLYGNWGTFTASDVGITGMSFTGTDWWLGGEMIANVYQHKDLFLDVLGGARYRRVSVSNELMETEGDAALVEAKLHLNAFLASTEESFPGLWNRIKRYDGAFEKAGRSGALEDLNDLLYELSLRSRQPERQQFLDAEIRRRRGDSLMTRLLTELKGLQGGGAGGLREVNAILGEAALRKKPEARELYLETEMVKNRANPELFQFLERLLSLVRPSP